MNCSVYPLELLTYCSQVSTFIGGLDTLKTFMVGILWVTWPLVLSLCCARLVVALRRYV